MLAPDQTVLVKNNPNKLVDFRTCETPITPPNATHITLWPTVKIYTGNQYSSFKRFSDYCFHRPTRMVLLIHMANILVILFNLVSGSEDKLCGLSESGNGG